MQINGILYIRAIHDTMRTVLSLWLLIVALMLQAQIQVEEHYFADERVAEGGKVFDHIVLNGDIIVTGTSFDSRPFSPSIVRLDTLGAVVWTTTTHDTSTYTVQMAVTKIMLAADGFLYASCAQQTFIPQQEIWKVDPLTGTIAWKVPFTTYNEIEHLLDVDSTRLGIGHASSYNSSTYATQLAFLDKGSGALIGTHHIGDRPWQERSFGMAVDDADNIYYTITDSLYKVRAADPDSIIWRNAFAAAQVGQYGHIHVDSTGVYLLGSRISSPSARVVSVDPVDGTLNWWSNPMIADRYFSDMVDRNGSLYITWRHAYVGGGFYSWSTCRIDKASGSVLWMNPLQITPVGAPDQHSGGGQAALSMDIDSAGDLYLTGYQGDANYGPECWAVAKLNGANGSVLFDTVITLFPATYDNASWGRAACVIGDRPFFVGDLETLNINYYEATAPYLVALDPQTGAPVRMVPFGGAYRFPSSLVDMQVTSDDRLVVLKQEGLSCALEKYGPDSTLIWRRTLRRGYALFGEVLTVDGSGRIVVAAQSRLGSVQAPFYATETDSIHLFRFDTNGSIDYERGFPVDLQDVNSVQVVTDAPGNSLFLLYRKGTGLFVRRLSGSTTSAETNLNLTYANVTGEGHYARERSGASFHLIAKSTTPGVKVYAVDKNSLVKTEVDALPFASYVADVAPVSDHLSLLSGVSNSRDMLVLYDHQALDTVWMRRYDFGTRLHGAVVNDLGTNAFAFGMRTSEPRGPLLRAVDLTNGLVDWTYLHEATGADNAGLAAAVDEAQGLVAFTGYVSDDSIPQVRNAFLDVLDLSGVPQLAELYNDNWPEEGKGLSMARVPNDDLWLGGYKGEPGSIKPGFLFRLVNAVSIGHEDLSAQGDLELVAYPNPFSDKLVVHWKGASATVPALRIFGVDGRSIRPPVIATSSGGGREWRVDMTGLVGCYLIELTVDGRRHLAKVVGMQ